jgi:hypothetical protein
LRGVDEDRHDGAIGAFLREAHKREVAFMQRPHGGHQRDRLPAGAIARHGTPQ